MFFFFSSRRRHTRLTCDWSSDVCSSDLCSIGIGERTKKIGVLAAGRGDQFASAGEDIHLQHRFVGQAVAERRRLDTQAADREIGRAACRERGKSATGAGGSIQKQV